MKTRLNMLYNFSCLFAAMLLGHGVAAHPAKPPGSGTVERGRVLLRTLQQEPALSYYLYLPKRSRRNAPVLVSVHGISRNAREHARRFADYAERYGVVLVAPLFDKENYRSYQRFEGAQRADLALDRIITEVGRMTGAATEQLYLFGYSGGGQFVHRYAMAYSQRVASIAVGAAGWYTFPDPQRNFPYGTRPRPDWGPQHFDPAQYLRVPACVLVGEEDVERDEALNQSRRIDRRQGDNRVERGRRWVEVMQAQARSRGFNTTYQFELLPAAGHSFRSCVKQGGLAERVFHCLFGLPPPGDKTG